MRRAPTTQASPPGSRGMKSPEPQSSHRVALLLVFCLVASGIALRVIHLPVAVYTPDEDTYADFYAVRMYDHGLGELPKLVWDYNHAGPDALAYPSPTRVGHLWAIVGLMKLTRHPTLRTAAWVSCLASMLMLVLIARIGTRFLGPWTGAVALLFAAVSPPDLAMARRVWGDELVALCALGAAWAFLEHAAAPGRGFWALCMAFAGFAILVKETGLLLLALATIGLAMVAWRRADPRSGRWSGPALSLLSGAVTLVIAVWVLVTACGGLEPLRVTFARAVAAEANPYMLKYQTGGPGYYALGLALLWPLPSARGVLAAAAAAWRSALPRLGAWLPRAGLAPATLGWFTIAFAITALAYPQKNLRFLSPIYAPLALLAAWLVSSLMTGLRSRLPSPAYRVAVALVAIGLLAAAVADHMRFVEYFVRRGIPDLAVPWFEAPR